MNQQASIEKRARELAEQLFTNGSGSKARHLRLHNAEGTYLGDWSEQPVVDQIETVLCATVSDLTTEIERLNQLINTPHTNDWLEAVKLEAAHQIERWGTDHDAGKTPLDWFWLIGYLAQKAVMSVITGDTEKAKHHTISTGAVLLNWFRRLVGDDKAFEPGSSDARSIAKEVGY